MIGWWVFINEDEMNGACGDQELEVRKTTIDTQAGSRTDGGGR